VQQKLFHHVFFEMPTLRSFFHSLSFKSIVAIMQVVAFILKFIQNFHLTTVFGILIVKQR
jgi:hypothetical protein